MLAAPVVAELVRGHQVRLPRDHALAVVVPRVVRNNVTSMSHKPFYLLELNPVLRYRVWPDLKYRGEHTPPTLPDLGEPT